jgi:DNA polymerase-3 subunit epsilon
MGLFTFRRPLPETVWALDLETSGLDARRAAILAVGMVPIRGGAIRLGEAYESRVKPPAGSAPSIEGMRIHHLVPSELEKSPTVEGVVPDIERRLAGAALLVHGRAIDVPFLKRAFRVASRPWPKPRVIDTMDLIDKLDRRREMHDPTGTGRSFPRNLTKARRALGLPEYVAHDALSDAIATAELWLLLASLTEGFRRQER